MQGYRGKLLIVNLTSGQITEQSLDESLARQFIGGSGLGVRLLYDKIDAQTDPLGVDNPLMFLTGPFAGTMVPTGSKMTVCAKSPLTGLLGYSTVGGHLGADIKFAGLDGIIFEGQSPKPVYLYVNDSEYELRDAAHLWGKDTEVVWETLKEETGHRNAGIARIGIAGENLVKYACIIVDHHRAAGRTGMGAVMGSKKLKAIVINGTDRKVPVTHPNELVELAKAMNADKSEDPTFTMYTDLGSSGYVDMASMMYGSMPARYYTVGEFDSYDVSGTSMKETILVGKTACYRCPIGCGRKIDIKEGKYATGEFSGPEYETMGSMGTLLLNNNLESIAFANKQLALFGIDSITGGNTIAFVYYLFSEGKITAKDIDGITPEWGEVDSALAFLEKIAKREGVGNDLAEGSLHFGKKHGVEELAVQMNGMEPAMHDPRGFSGLAITYATSPRGACHMTADMYNIQMGQIDESWDIESNDRFDNEADLVARVQNFRCITNSALTCNFYPIYGNEMANCLSLVTGWDITVEELKKTAERIFTLERLLNLKLGYNSKNEGLPKLLLQPLEGPTEEHVPDVEAHLDKWYEYRGWDRETGMPSPEQIKTLGLEDMTI